MSARNVYISRRNFMKAGAVAAAMASLGVPAMAAPAGEENCLWSNITPRRSTQYGPVVGLDQGESLVWYGIPYGAAPVGELRWQAPQDPAVWTEAKDCTAPSEVAYQYGSGVIGTEDCLKLDVYTTPNAHKLPVLVFIHGGNNQTGNTKEILGSELVVRDNCVFVTLDYRLGLFGFNCLPSAGAAMTLATSPCWISQRRWTGSRITLHSLAAMRTTSPSPVSRPAVVT